MIRVYATWKLDTSNTSCKRRIGNRTPEFSLPNCYLRQALSKWVSFTRHECRLSRWCLSNAASQWVKCYCKVAEKITFATFSCHRIRWSREQTKPRLLKVKHLEARNLVEKASVCLPSLVYMRQICETPGTFPTFPSRRSMFERHYLHSFTNCFIRNLNLPPSWRESGCDC